MQCIPIDPTFICLNWGILGYTIFLIFDLNHTLRAKMKTIKIVQLEFLQRKKLYVAWVRKQ